MKELVKRIIVIVFGFLVTFYLATFIFSYLGSLETSLLPF